MDCSIPGFSVHHQLLLKPMSIEADDAIQPSHPLSSPFPSALNLSQHQSFQMSHLFASGGQNIAVSALRSVLPMKHPGLVSFRMGWLNLLATQGTLKSLLQHHSSKAPILRQSGFFMAQLSHPYMTTGKTRALTRWTFVGKVMLPCL